MRSGSRTLPNSASCSSARGPAWARARIAAELVHRELRVGAPPQRVRPSFDEGLDQWPVLVQRGPVVGRVLFERERQLVAALQLREQRAERAEAERPERCEELWRAHDHRARAT